MSSEPPNRPSTRPYMPKRPSETSDKTAAAPPPRPSRRPQTATAQSAQDEEAPSESPEPSSLAPKADLEHEDFDFSSAAQKSSASAASAAGGASKRDLAQRVEALSSQPPTPESVQELKQIAAQIDANPGGKVAQELGFPQLAPRKAFGSSLVNERRASGVSEPEVEGAKNHVSDSVVDPHKLEVEPAIEDETRQVGSQDSKSAESSVAATQSQKPVDEPKLSDLASSSKTNDLSKVNFDDVTEEFQTGIEAQALETARDPELPDSIDENFQRSREAQDLETSRDPELPDLIDERFQRGEEAQKLETARDPELPDSVDEQFQRGEEAQKLETARDPELSDSIDENFQRSREAQQLETARDPELPDSIDEKFQRGKEAQALETARDPELPDSVDEKFQRGKEAQALETARDLELPDSVDEKFQRGKEAQSLETARDPELPDSVDEKFQRGEEARQLETARDPELPDSVDEKLQHSTEAQRSEKARDSELPDSVDEKLQRSAEAQQLETAREPELPDSVDEKTQQGEQDKRLEKSLETSHESSSLSHKEVSDTKSVSHKDGPSTIETEKAELATAEKPEDEAEPRRSLASIRSAFEEGLKAKKEPPPRPMRRPTSFDTESSEKSTEKPEEKPAEKSADKPDAPERPAQRPARPAKPIKPLLHRTESDASAESPAAVKKAPPPRPSNRPRLASQFEDAIKAQEVERKPLPAKPSGRVAGLQSALFADLSSALAKGPPGTARPPKPKRTETDEQGSEKAPVSEESADAQLSAMPANPRSSRARKGPQRRLPELAKSKLTISFGVLWELPGEPDDSSFEAGDYDDATSFGEPDTVKEPAASTDKEIFEETLEEPIDFDHPDTKLDTKLDTAPRSDGDEVTSATKQAFSAPEPAAELSKETKPSEPDSAILSPKSEVDNKESLHHIPSVTSLNSDLSRSATGSPATTQVKIEPQAEEALREAIHTSLSSSDATKDLMESMPPLGNLLDKSIDTAPNQTPLGQSSIGIAAGGSALGDAELGIPQLSALVDRTSSPLHGAETVHHPDPVTEQPSTDKPSTETPSTEENTKPKISETSQERLQHVRERLWAAQEKHQAAGADEDGTTNAPES